MVSRKVKGLDDRISSGRITKSSEDIFEVETHRMQNVSYAQKKNYEKLFFSRKDASYFNSPKTGARVRVVFNNPKKDYVEEIYDFRWNILIYKKI